MKYLSLAMVAVILVLSWFMIKSPADLTAEQHAKLQEVLKEYLAVYLKETNPTASDIQDSQVSTRVIERGKKMQAQFKFFYLIKDDTGGSNKIAREGVFSLTSENGNDWNAKMERISDTYLEFSDALQISLPGDNQAQTAEPAPQQQAPSPKTAEPAH